MKNWKERVKCVPVIKQCIERGTTGNDSRVCVQEDPGYTRQAQKTTAHRKYYFEKEREEEERMCVYH